ncbi:MAG: hypothetical protein MJY94_09750 [Bacteroidales bacterium]|nr:hypothetical protein [Bacteroidales bacterium]
MLPVCYIDLVAGGHDHEGPFEYGDNGEVEYMNMPIVFWGNGRTFNHDDWTRFPQTPVEGFGIVTDFEFFDIDGDGVDEIILSRTGDGKFCLT